MSEQEIEQEITPSPAFVKGFNEGYIMAKHMPEAAADISKALGDSERGHGFKGGLQEYAAEADHSFYPDWMKSHLDSKEQGQDKDVEHGKSYEADRNDKEPEI